MRRFACVGDTLIPGGGVVLPYEGRPAFFDEHQPALIGGQARCNACNSIGVVAKAGGPRRLEFMGEIALDEDIVLCKCPSPPRIAATLAGDRWYEDMAGNDDESELLASDFAWMPAPEWESYDEMVVATGPHGPITDYPYFIETSDGRGHFGYTDSEGQLPRIATISASAFAVYWGDEALAMHLEHENA